ncbi:hypothetical protein BDA96_09G138100 [Sorghum bicolor]|uniref:Peptidase A1 domain-containing protein n=1 Tax=Sorghum bicolor TaxID=4558 RepID=A0A921U501_SORBI|nr:hypothetical protein BDA96_09G138100 [Sorghum bicolor]
MHADIITSHRHHVPHAHTHIMARHPASSASPLALAAAALLFLCLLSACRAAAAGSKQPISAVVLPVSKDDATQQYVTGFRQRTPLVPVKAVLDLAGATLWVDCDGYASSTYTRVPCGSTLCRGLSRSPACATTCSGAPSPSCLNDTCGGFPENTVTRLSTGGNVITDVLALPTTFRPAPAPGPLATAPAFLFACGSTSLTRGLAAGAAGMASLSRARFALPTQLASTFRFSRKFALCLPPAAAAGVVVFGDAPAYAFQPGVALSATDLTYTRLLVNPVSTAGVSARGDKSDEYFVGVTGIKVNGRAVPLNATLLAIDRKRGGVGGTKLSTVAPYTVLESSIYKAVTDAFAAETAMIPRAPAPPVPPFKLCYDGSKVGSTRVGPAVPTIELVLGDEATSWVVFGANSMVATQGGALCLGVVDGGKAPRTSVVIGGHMMEDNLLQFDLEASRLGFSSSLLFRQTNCNNFHLG